MKKTKRIITLFLALILSLGTLLSLGACSDSDNTVYLVIENYGMVTIELYKSKAPITVKNFKKLVNDDFYDGLTFHRIIESFMIQGGDPKGDGTGGADEDIIGEFAANGYNTGIEHIEGTISMARSGSPYEEYFYAGYNVPPEYLEPAFNSASSQFFIVTETSVKNSNLLDGKYAAFGRVTEGMDVVKRVAAVKTGENDKPIVPVKIAVITFDRAEAEAMLQK